MFIDTHAHLNFAAFEKDYTDAIERAFDNNVKAIINVGSNLETSQKAVEIAKVFSSSAERKNSGGIYASVGLHPIHVQDEKFDFQKFWELAKDARVVAVGETGVDLHYRRDTLDLQHDVFEKLLKIAYQVNKPVILHCRDAEEDMRAWLMGQEHLPRGVFHCFPGDWNFAKFVLDLGFLISFTGVITFSKNQKTLEVIRKIPLGKIMIETDCPFLTPDPYRGRRNEPAYVIEVAKKIAEIKKILLEEVEKQTTENAKKLFKL